MNIFNYGGGIRLKKEKFCQNDKMFELVKVEEDLCWLPDKTVCKEFIKEKTLHIPKQKPVIEQLANKVIKPKITSHKVIKTKRKQSKVIIQGKIIEKVFYVADRPEQTVHAAKFTFPFCNFINLGKKVAKIKDVKVNVEDVVVQLVKKKEIRQCILLFICAIPHEKYRYH